MLLDSPIMLSFPHFYLADPKLREAVEGISEPDPEKHGFWLDVQPVINLLLWIYEYKSFFYYLYVLWRLHVLFSDHGSRTKGPGQNTD